MPESTNALRGGRVGWSVITWSNLDIFIIVGFLHQGEMFPPPEAARDGGGPKFLLEDRTLAFADL